MATYKESVGTAVTNVAGDFPGAADGELWFNSTDSSFQYKYAATSAGWSTGGNLNTGRRSTGRAGTSQTASLIVGGQEPRASDGVLTELYNGTNWTEVNDLNTARYGMAGAGTSTDALAFGGEVPPNSFQNITESWNGTNWTNENSLNSERAYNGGVGTGTAGLTFGGQQSTADTAATEAWDGTGFITKTITTTTD